MDSFDAVVVGAGPAGGQVARQLSKSGFRILLIEKAPSFSANDFSSAGAPLDILSHFDLPHSVVGKYCREIRITSSNDTHLWQAKDPFSVVLDFKKLRCFLADETLRNGSFVRLGCRYQSHEILDGQTLVHLKRRGNKNPETVKTRVLIDATGSERRVLAGGKEHPGSSKKAIVGRGIEYLIEVPESVYDIYANCLSFYIGTKWMPQGYAWIFPMEAHRLKIGVGRNYPDEQIVPHEKSMEVYLDRLIHECLKTEPLNILDKHGKTIAYTRHQQDLYIRQNLIAIGDATSTVNPFTFEGIRHALKSGHVAAHYVQAFLRNGQKMNQYPAEIRRYFGFKWVVSEMLADRIYREPNDQKMTLMLRALKSLSLRRMKALVFDYSLKSAIKFYATYQFLLFKHLFCQTQKENLLEKHR